MYRNYDSFNIFNEEEIDSYFNQKLMELKNKIYSLPQSQILDGLSDVQRQEILKEFTIDKPEFDMESAKAAVKEVEVSSEDLGSSFYTHPGRIYKKNMVTYYIPVKGDSNLLRYIPSQQRLMWTEEVYICDSDLCVDIKVFSENADQIKREFDHFKSSAITQLGHLNREISGYNNSLDNKINEYISSRKNEIARKDSLASSLGVPIRE